MENQRKSKGKRDVYNQKYLNILENSNYTRKRWKQTQQQQEEEEKKTQYRSKPKKYSLNNRRNIVFVIEKKERVELRCKLRRRKRVVWVKMRYDTSGKLWNEPEKKLKAKQKLAKGERRIP